MTGGSRTWRKSSITAALSGLSAGLAFVVIATVGAASGKTQIIESSHQRLGNTSTLRIAPLAGQSPVQNIIDVLNFGRTDAAIVPSDLLPYLRDGRSSITASVLFRALKIDVQPVSLDQPRALQQCARERLPRSCMWRRAQ